jgi:hypothetical protein
MFLLKFELRVHLVTDYWVLTPFHPIRTQAAERYAASERSASCDWLPEPAAEIAEEQACMS